MLWTNCWNLDPICIMLNRGSSIGVCVVKFIIRYWQCSSKILTFVCLSILACVSFPSLLSLSFNLSSSSPLPLSFHLPGGSFYCRQKKWKTGHFPEILPIVNWYDFSGKMVKNLRKVTFAEKSGEKWLLRKKVTKNDLVQKSGQD
jgi:hypothetical protein